MVLVEDHAGLLAFFRAFRGARQSLGFCSDWGSPWFAVHPFSGEYSPLPEKLRGESRNGSAGPLVAARGRSGEQFANPLAGFPGQLPAKSVNGVDFDFV